MSGAAGGPVPPSPLAPQPPLVFLADMAAEAQQQRAPSVLSSTAEWNLQLLARNAQAALKLFPRNSSRRRTLLRTLTAGIKLEDLSVLLGSEAATGSAALRSACALPDSSASNAPAPSNGATGTTVAAAAAAAAAGGSGLASDVFDEFELDTDNMLEDGWDDEHEDDDDDDAALDDDDDLSLYRQHGTMHLPVGLQLQYTSEQVALLRAFIDDACEQADSVRVSNCSRRELYRRYVVYSRYRASALRPLSFAKTCKVLAQYTWRYEQNPQACVLCDRLTFYRHLATTSPASGSRRTDSATPAPSSSAAAATSAAPAASTAATTAATSSSSSNGTETRSSAELSSDLAARIAALEQHRERQRRQQQCLEQQLQALVESRDPSWVVVVQDFAAHLSCGASGAGAGAHRALVAYHYRPSEPNRLQELYFHVSPTLASVRQTRNFVRATWDALLEFEPFHGAARIDIWSDGGRMHFALLAQMRYWSRVQATRRPTAITCHYFASYHGEHVCQSATTVLEPLVPTDARQQHHCVLVAPGEIVNRECAPGVLEIDPTPIEYLDGELERDRSPDAAAATATTSSSSSSSSTSTSTTTSPALTPLLPSGTLATAKNLRRFLKFSFPSRHRVRVYADSAQPDSASVLLVL